MQATVYWKRNQLTSLNRAGSVLIQAFIHSLYCPLHQSIGCQVVESCSNMLKTIQLHEVTNFLASKHSPSSAYWPSSWGNCLGQPPVIGGVTESCSTYRPLSAAGLQNPYHGTVYVEISLHQLAVSVLSGNYLC